MVNNGQNLVNVFKELPLKRLVHQVLPQLVSMGQTLVRGHSLSTLTIQSIYHKQIFSYKSKEIIPQQGVGVDGQ